MSDITVVVVAAAAVAVVFAVVVVVSLINRPTAPVMKYETPPSINNF